MYDRAMNTDAVSPFRVFFLIASFRFVLVTDKGTPVVGAFYYKTILKYKK